MCVAQIPQYTALKNWNVGFCKLRLLRDSFVGARQSPDPTPNADLAPTPHQCRGLDDEVRALGF